jgi:hypothetical protein
LPVLCVTNEFGDIPRRQGVVDHQHVRRSRDAPDRHEVSRRLVGQVLAQVRQDRVDGGGRQQQHIAVGRGLGDEVRAKRTARAGPVVDDDLLAERFRHLLRNQACELVGGAARRIGHDQADRAVRVPLRVRAGGDCE